MSTLAIVGATGAVGQEMLECLNQAHFHFDKLVLLASARSAGKSIQFQGKELIIEELTKDSFKGVEIALFSAGGGISREFAPIAAAAGAVVIDNSSAFRMDADVPLIVPEINGELAKNTPRNIIANPNCTTIVSLMALAPLHRAFGLKAVIASSYQAVSGSGAQGIIELDEQAHAYAKGEPITPKIYSKQIFSNAIPLIGNVTENGYTDEEMKLTKEGAKILGMDSLRASITCVRVPVMRSHSVTMTAQFERPASVEAARAAIDAFDGVQIMDDPENGVFPSPLDVTNGDDCMVGRIRPSIVLKNALDLWVVGDQVRKGAALNAVQIAQLLVSQ